MLEVIFSLWSQNNILLSQYITDHMYNILWTSLLLLFIFIFYTVTSKLVLKHGERSK